MKDFIKYIGLSNFIALDLETTGLNPQKDKIIELSAYKFSNGKPVKSFTSLINPEKNISPISTQITGIKQSMLKDKPLFENLQKDFIHNKKLCNISVGRRRAFGEILLLGGRHSRHVR